MSELVWSYSMLDMYEECPMKWYNKYILKLKEPSGPALEYGNFVHKSIENHLYKNVPLPTELDGNIGLISSIKKQFIGLSRAEYKMGISKALKPCDFFAKDVWGRGAADVVLIPDSEDSAFIGDWKTGKKYDKEDQVKILAMLLFKFFPRLQTIKGANIWLKDNTLGEVYTFTREYEERMWVSLLQRLQKMYAAVGTPAAVETRPGFICKYCPVKNCKFNQSKG